MKQFSGKSLERLNTCHPDIIKVLHLALERSDIDFGISHGHRTPAEQFALYQKGRSQPGNIVTYKDGFKNKSKHNEKPSLAVDIYCWPREIMYDEKHLIYVAGVIMTCAKELGVNLTWGFNWNKNGLLVSSDPNEKFVDMPHFQL